MLTSKRNLKEVKKKNEENFKTLRERYLFFFLKPFLSLRFTFYFLKSFLISKQPIFEEKLDEKFDDVRYSEELVQFFLEKFTKENDKVFDPFCGKYFFNFLYIYTYFFFFLIFLDLELHSKFVKK